MEDIFHQIINTLMREYELHRQELFLQIELYNRQTKYIQIYGAFLLGLIAFLFGLYPERIKSWFGVGQNSRTMPLEMFQVSSLPTIVIIALLIIAAVIIFYFVSIIMASSYMFLIIRRRMAQIEQQVNTLLRRPGLLNYETRVTPHFLEKWSYGVNLYTPHFLSSIWRVLLFLSVIGILNWLAITLLPTPYGYIYCILIDLSSFFLIFQYAKLYRKGKEKIDRFYISREQELHKNIHVRFSVWLFLVIGLLISATIVFFPYLVENIYLMFAS